MRGIHIILTVPRIGIAVDLQLSSTANAKRDVTCEVHMVDHTFGPLGNYGPGAHTRV